MSREEEIADFLAYAGYADARAAPLAQDASFRRYWRIAGGPRPAVLMDAPPPEAVRPFLVIGAHLRGLGLSVPEVLAADEGDGLVLLEDLGDDLFSTLLSPRTGPAMFDVAVDLLVEMQRAPASAPGILPDWDVGTMAAAAEATLLDWWWPATFGTPVSDAVRQEFRLALFHMLFPLADAAQVFVHRDFFAGNLIWLPERVGVQRVGLLDFQSAAWGHPAYDLASLIEDARRDIPPELAERCVARFLAARPELDPEAFRTALAICKAQRHLRVAAQWVRLARRDGRPHYLTHGPRTWRLLGEALRHPAAAPLASVFDRWIPPERRGNPPDLDA
jgi:aminoglycoside/choline kinase family phosphotransferase